jgi:uncharacterized linocin/CFP29 family protein
MDILRRSLAPISQDGWNEIEEQAKDVFYSVLTGRKFAEIDGPHGFSHAAVSTGRLEVPEGQDEKDVRYGINKVMPLMETRKSFKVNIWELDNAVRGAEDINLEEMEEAAKEIAEFEENAIYNGFDKACIKGLKNSSDHEQLEFPDNPEDILKTITTAINQMKESFIDGPDTLILGTEKWQKLMASGGGYPLYKRVEDLLNGGNIILNPYIKEGYLLNAEGGDFKLTLGQDLSIGYESHDEKEVKLFFTESFTFQVLDPAAVIAFK